MTASRAYIAGLGTTGVLVGFALMTLAVFGALLAFQGWPGEAAVEDSGPVGIRSGQLIDPDRVRLVDEAGQGGRGPREGAPRASGRRAGGERGGRSDLIGVAGVQRSGGAGSHAPEPGEAGTTDPTTASAPPAAPDGGGASAGLPSVERAAGGALDAVGQTVAPATEGVAQAGEDLSQAVSGAGGAAR